MYRVAAAALKSSIRSSTAKKLVSSRVIYSRNYVAKDINFGIGPWGAMLLGVNELAEAVKVTMGPKGRNVIIEESHGNPKVTKDGVTVAKIINFKEKAKNVGAALVKQVASATNTAAGDGTTLAIFTEGCKSVAAGVNVMDLRRGISKAVDAVIADLKSIALMIGTPEEITQVATISANGEHEIRELIARAMEKVGKEGVITVADGNTLDNELEVVDGMKLGRGYMSPYFVTDQKTQKCDLEHPLILIHEKQISDMNVLVKILELAVEKNRPLLIVAEDVESDALAMLIINKHQAGVKVCAIKAPGFGDNRRANLEDLAILTGGEVISEERGSSLDKVQIEMLGTAKKVTVSLGDTIVKFVLHGGGAKHIEEINFPKRKFIHVFRPGRHKGGWKGRNEQKEPEEENKGAKIRKKVMAMWRTFRKVGPIRCLRSRKGTEEGGKEVRDGGVESIEKEERRIWPKKKQGYGYHDRTQSGKILLSKLHGARAPK